MLALPRLALVTHRRRITGPSLLGALEEVFGAGVSLAVLRERDLEAADLLATARKAAALAREAGARLLVNDRVDVALLAQADGVHLRASSVSAREARILAERSGAAPFLVGVSVHAPEEAERAEREGADYLFFGPVFETPDKAPFGPPSGLGALASVARRTRLPVYAIGGVTPERAADCLRAGAHGIAAMGGILGAPDLTRRVREYRRALAEAERAPRPRAGSRRARPGGKR